MFCAKRKIGVQSFTNDLQALRISIEILTEKYKESIALFDINKGCPAPKITNNGEGCALMKTPALAELLIKTAVTASTVPVDRQIPQRLG